MPFTLSITNGVQSHSVELSAEGLNAIYDALEVGADGFGQTDSDAAVAAEQEAWLVINALKLAIQMPTSSNPPLVFRDDLPNEHPAWQGSQNHPSNQAPLDPGAD